jgi:EAL and modified HD-GYP domain-containing signal transduction protein
MHTDEIAAGTQELYLGLQPIFDRHLQIYAYELLFRSEDAEVADIINAHEASATVIHHVFNKLGAQSVLGPHRGFINLDASMLASRIIERLPTDRVVLEILETVKVDRHVVSRCEALKQMGFQLALDDFTGHEAAFAPLLPLVDVIKVDLQQVPPRHLAETTRKLRRWRAMLLAEKVDTAEQAHYCRQLGYDLFQGYHLGRPRLIAFGHRPDSLSETGRELIDVRRRPR